MEAEGERLHQSAAEVIFRQVGAGAPSRLTVVGDNDFIYIFPLGRSLFRQGEEQVILCRCPLETALRQTIHDDLLRACSRINCNQLFAIHTVSGVVISCALGHPAQVLCAFSDYFAGSHFGHLCDAFRLTAHLVGAVGSDEVFAIC